MAKGSRQGNGEEFYSVKDVADKLKVSERTVWRWIADKRLMVIRIGGVVRISISEIDKLLRGE